LFRFMGKIEMQKNDTSIEKLYFLLLMWVEFEFEYTHERDKDKMFN
jgi:hypothetical protein